MDEQTKKWLDERFRYVDKDGIYKSHQPIYGFRKGHCEPNIMPRYAITLRILDILRHTEFSSVLDVGAAEGYKTALIASLYNASVQMCDASEEACKRAKDIFGLEGRQAEINALPFENESFDIAVCSEVLEHVPDLEKAVGELLRVSRKAVIITVPMEEELHNAEDLHAHIHSLNKNSFDFAVPQGGVAIARRMNTNLFCRFFWQVESDPNSKIKQCGLFKAALQNAARHIGRIVWTKAFAAFALNTDGWLANRTSTKCNSLLVTILKDASFYNEKSLSKAKTGQMLDFSVPLHRLSSVCLPIVE